MANYYLILIGLAMLKQANAIVTIGQNLQVKKGFTVETFDSVVYGISMIKCAEVCLRNGKEGKCNLAGYHKGSRSCFLSLDNIGYGINEADSDFFVIELETAVCESPEYLVGGPDKVPDAQLTASSVYDDDPIHVASVARLHSLPSPTNIGAWAAWTLDVYQYIQVQFNGLSQVVGVAVQGRHVNTDSNLPDFGCCVQRVTSYKVLYSWDCQHFTTVEDTNGSEMIFAGNTDQDTVVTSMLPKQVSALCVRINPVTWLNHITLRFDVLGCEVN